jgi:hypothetical protein
MRSWLQDPDGDGTYVFNDRIPGELRVQGDPACRDENYGAGGANGANIGFSVLPTGPSRPSTTGSHEATVKTSKAGCLT